MTSADFERILREAGWTASDIQRSIDISKLSDAEFEATLELIHAAKKRSEKAATRRALHLHAATSSDIP
jgi:hypothetical protein